MGIHLKTHLVFLPLHFSPLDDDNLSQTYRFVVLRQIVVGSGSLIGLAGRGPDKWLPALRFKILIPDLHFSETSPPKPGKLAVLPPHKHGIRQQSLGHLHLLCPWTLFSKGSITYKSPVRLTSLTIFSTHTLSPPGLRSSTICCYFHLSHSIFPVCTPNPALYFVWYGRNGQYPDSRWFEV